MLEKGQIALREDAVSARDEIRDPYLLECLDLKDEYSEGELEEALIRRLEWFLLELGAGFTFVARRAHGAGSFSGSATKAVGNALALGNGQPRTKGGRGGNRGEAAEAAEDAM